MKYRLQFLVLLATLMLVWLAGCGAEGSDVSAAVAVEDYLQSQVNKDLNRMISLSCADWEEAARLEYNALAALTVSLDNPDCRVTQQDGETALVSCNGNMVFNYGTEVLEKALADLVYRLVNDGGVWLVCGYQ